MAICALSRPDFSAPKTIATFCPASISARARAHAWRAVTVGLVMWRGVPVEA
jgi:hypothetical protein